MPPHGSGRPLATMAGMEPATPTVRPRPAFGIVAWFVWVAILLAVTGLLLPQVIASSTSASGRRSRCSAS